MKGVDEEGLNLQGVDVLNGGVEAEIRRDGRVGDLGRDGDLHLHIFGDVE